MLKLSSTTHRPIRMVAFTIGSLSAATVLIVGMIAHGPALAEDGERARVSPPSVRIESAGRTFGAHEAVEFSVRNNAKSQIYYFCGLEIQVGAQWRETATDVTRPFGSKAALVRPVPGAGVATASFRPVDVLGEGYSKVVASPRVRLKCWYMTTRAERDGEDRVVRSEPFEFRP